MQFSVLMLAVMIGKQILLKAVASAVPVYVVHVFKFPKMVYGDLNKALAHFWWSNNDKDICLHCKS